MKTFRDQLNLTLEIYANSQFGNLNKTVNKYTGLLGDLYNGDIDLTGVNLNINLERFEAFHFLPPLITRYYGFVVKTSNGVSKSDQK